MLRFPYHQGRPRISLILEYGHTRKSFLPLLDSGADFSIFHQSVLSMFSLDPAQGAVRQVDNADGSKFEVREFILSVELQEMRFPARICFADTPALIEFPLLGRMDVFDKFRVVFCDREQYVELIPNSEEVGESQEGS